jgi:hypothetical protein
MGSVFIQFKKTDASIMKHSFAFMYLQSLLIRFLTVMGFPGTLRDPHIGEYRCEA